MHFWAILATTLALCLKDVRSFAIQNPACSLDSYTIVPNNGSGIWPYREYTSSNNTPPQLSSTQNGQEISPEHIFLTVDNAGLQEGEKQIGPAIITNSGDLVWSGPEGSTSNLRVQELDNKHVLSYWIGRGDAAKAGQAGHGYGSVVILDSSYHPIYTVCPDIQVVFPPGIPDGCAADVHESFITPQNTLLVTVYNITRADLTSVGGPQDGWVYDTLAIEVDIKTNKTLWTWSALDHVPVSASKLPLGSSGTSSSSPYDFFHMNAIQPFNGNVLINSRHTCTSYLVDHSGKILWEINGATGGDFGPLSDEAKFSWQHHARLHPTGKNDSLLLTYFANQNYQGFTTNPSVGLSLEISLPPSKEKSPVLRAHFVDNADPVASYAEGSHQILANGNAFVGYGIRAALKEFGPDGTVRWGAQFGYINGSTPGNSYRAFKQEWHGIPRTAPSLVVAPATANDGLKSCANGSNLRGYVSWNGATHVRAYIIYTGTESQNLRPTAEVAKKGFETEFVVPSGVKFVRVAAIVEGQSRSDACATSDIIAV